MAQSFWPRVPVIVEPGHYGQTKTWWGTWGDGSPYLESIERYHASYAGVHGWPREFLDENRGLIDRINRRLGYRIQLCGASWPARVAAGERLAVSWTWRNAGVAPCYPGGHPALTLKDAEGGITAVLVDPDLTVRDLPVGPMDGTGELASEVVFGLPAALAVSPGVHTVFVSVGSIDGTPRIALPLDGDDGQRRYRLGTMEVLAGTP